MTKAEAIEYVLNNIENIQDQYDYDYIGVRTQENAFTKGGNSGKLLCLV